MEKPRKNTNESNPVWVTHPQSSTMHGVVAEEAGSLGYELMDVSIDRFGDDDSNLLVRGTLVHKEGGPEKAFEYRVAAGGEVALREGLRKHLKPQQG